MRIFVSVKTGVRVEKIEKIDETHLAVSVREWPLEGRANRAVLSAVADYFSISPSRVTIVSGASSREKLLDIAL